MKTETTIEDFLTGRSYKVYPQKFDYPYTKKNLYQHRLTDLETNAVCETNDKLFINVEEYQFGENNLQYSIAIVAERHSIWWDLKAYSLSADELIEKIEFLENSLIKIFNGL